MSRILNQVYVHGWLIFNPFSFLLRRVSLMMWTCTLLPLLVKIQIMLRTQNLVIMIINHSLWIEPFVLDFLN